MIDIIITEFQKLKRYSILWVGVVAVLLSALLAVYQQTGGWLYYENYTNNVIWNNYSMTFPFMIVLIGGYMINREYIDHTLKNLLTVPVSFRELLTGKLISIGLVTALYGIFSFICTLVLAVMFGFKNISPALVAKSLFQLVGMGLCIYIAVLPIIIFFSRKQNGFLAGVGLAFVYGFCGIFVAGRKLTDYYPITTGLGIVGFTGSGGAGSLTFNIAMELLVLFLMVVISVIMFLCMKDYEDEAVLSKNKVKKQKVGHFFI